MYKSKKDMKILSKLVETYNTVSNTSNIPPTGKPQIPPMVNIYNVLKCDVGPNDACVSTDGNPDTSGGSTDNITYYYIASITINNTNDVRNEPLYNLYIERSNNAIGFKDMNCIMLMEPSDCRVEISRLFRNCNKIISIDRIMSRLHTRLYPFKRIGSPEQSIDCSIEKTQNISYMKNIACGIKLLRMIVRETFDCILV